MVSVWSTNNGLSVEHKQWTQCGAQTMVSVWSTNSGLSVEHNGLGVEHKQ